ncbi:MULTISPECIES: acetylglutamate kinase [Hyphomonas]|uniref:Acetylglutamate kinase n=1 Tax=Hyphomonas adhaerens TaxID=81029 RepID=A0A3B9GYH7_9PROT|nr:MULTISPECIES: acetylglutamate kinase [Hyphomonas]MBB39457.1 acetylglutamate kinase [Hyphomonas sp.]HAE27266.1 acetylglutamate kinase [Hyphomonas adhaerens]|tara:strand:- start:11942 stop:12838 length:897 start_codon:yes stop_codon:yes gene_type:complete
MTDKFSAAQFTAKTLSEALPYIQRYVGQIVVVKYGGHAMVDESLSAMFARDVVLLKTLGIHPVIVHGGGPQIGKLLDRLGIVSEFKGGLRVTDEATMEVVEMVLSGPINKSIVRAINQAGGLAVGLSGSDGQLLQATKATKTERDPDSHIEQVLDLGFVGEPTGVDTSVIEALLQADSQLIPVVAPVAMGPDGHRFNVNADIAAGALAEALGASRLLLLTDVAGVLDKDKNLMRDIKVGTIPGLIEDGTAVGGMIPKLETAAHSVNHGVGAAVILDGRAPHALLMELFTEHGAGTLIS